MNEEKLRGLRSACIVALVFALFFASAVLSSCSGGGGRGGVGDHRSKRLDPGQQLDGSERLKLQEAYGRLPLAFEANRGQVDVKANFLARGSGGDLFLTSTGAVFALKGPATGKQPRHTGPFRMKLVGSNASVIPVGLEELPGRANYFIGNEPSKWRSNIPTFRKVKYSGVYPGVDLVYYGNQRDLEYDFVLAPGADPNGIRVAFEGVDALDIDDRGDLILKVAGAEVRQRRPRVYQELNGQKKEIRGAYVFTAKAQVAFRLEAYDKNRALLIDPVLVYSTYLGGTAADFGRSIAVDGSGSVYVVGDTASTNFPTASPLQAVNAGGVDAFVSKLNPAGSALLYSTYLGGSLEDRGYGIAVDTSGNAYLTGVTYSTNFPVVGSLQPNRGNGDAFVAKLNPAGSAIIYSTFLGGGQNDQGRAIAIDGSGNTYVTGFTYSSDFPTANPLQSLYGGLRDAFVAKLNATGSALVYSTYLGGSAADGGSGIAVDGSGNAYVTGDTSSTNFPIANPFQLINRGGGDAFVAKINGTGSSLVYSTYLGGTAADVGRSIAVDGSGNAYVVGDTSSTNFPTASPLQPYNAGGADVFVAKISDTGSALVYSTYLGGSSFDQGAGIALDGSGNAYVTGTTQSTNFPLAQPVQSANRGGYDGFVTKLSVAGSALVYSTYLGGSAFDEGLGIAVDGSGNAYVTGDTASTDFPVSSPLQPTNHGLGDAFIAKLGPTAPVVSSISPPSGPTVGGTPVTLRGTDFNSIATVSIGGVPATNIAVLSATQITAQTGPHAPGMVDVTITNPDSQSGTLPMGFTYVLDADGGTGTDGGRGTDGGQGADGGVDGGSGAPSSGGCSCQASTPGFSLWIVLAVVLAIVSRRKSLAVNAGGARAAGSLRRPE